MWLDFDSLVNARDLGGTPTRDGRVVQPGRLLRSDNLQDLTAADVVRLGELGVTDVVDLRTSVEVRATGDGPLTGHEAIRVHHHSYLIEPVEKAAPVDDDLPPTTLPWANRAVPATVSHTDTWASVYLSYLADRPDSVLAALRVIAHADGATLVHCAAGKDRTGTTVALALLVAGAEPDAVLADYAASNDRMERIIERLMAVQLYRPTLEGRTLASHATNPETMAAMVEWIAERHGDVTGLLATLGWTEDDTAALRHKLLDEAPPAGT